MIVVDASAVIELLVRSEAGARVARRLQAEEAIAAPELLDVEVVNAIRGLLRGGLISRRNADRAISGLIGGSIRRIPHLPLLARTWALRDRLSAYDAAYVALAQLLETRVLTVDARLARGAPRTRVELITL